MVGLLAVLAYLLVNVAALALDGRRRYGTFRAWWGS